MNQSIKLISCVHPVVSGNIKKYDCKTAAEVCSFHRTVPGYNPTPLAKLNCLAEETGLKGFYVKDESKRFGLNAFKFLGGSYAVARELYRRFGIPQEELDFRTLIDPSVYDRVKNIRFVTATDGNHGKGIARMAAMLGAKASVFMPKGSTGERLNSIRAEGAHAEIMDLNYDDTVDYAKAQVLNDPDALLVQDTSSEEYEDIPEWIMQGYTTIGFECMEQLGDVIPTHIFLQAGVGAFSGAMTAFFRNIYGQYPKIIIVEPCEADCIFRSAAAGDGKAHIVEGDMPSIMAGLCCGVPCGIAWNILKDNIDYCVSCPDCIAADGMRRLAAPAGTDPAIVSGESGAVTAGLVNQLMTNPELGAMKDEIGMGSSSIVLCISTEGDTDKENYEKIVNGGIYPVALD